MRVEEREGEEREENGRVCRWKVRGPREGEG